MTTETATQTPAATTTESQSASTTATESSATAAEAGGQQQQASGTPGAQSSAEQGTSAATAQPARIAPEKYEFAVPDGRKFDEVVLGEFSAVAKDLNLSQADAQKVLDRLAPAMADRELARIEEVRTAWSDSAKADKEFGGEHFDENVGLARKALDTFGTVELRTLLDETGLGNHPEFIRWAWKVGKAISEDRFVGGGSGQSQAPASIAQRMYPNMNP